MEFIRDLLVHNAFGVSRLLQYWNWKLMQKKVAGIFFCIIFKIIMNKKFTKK